MCKKFERNLHKICIRISFKFLANFFQISFKLYSKKAQILYKFCTKSRCKFVSKFVQNSHKLCTKFAWFKFVQILYKIPLQICFKFWCKFETFLYKFVQIWNIFVRNLQEICVMQISCKQVTNSIQKFEQNLNHFCIKFVQICFKSVQICTNLMNLYKICTNLHPDFVQICTKFVQICTNLKGR